MLAASASVRLGAQHPQTHAKGLISTIEERH